MAEVGSIQKVSRRLTKQDSRTRTRTGCRKCRERRVKCPEQRPICRSCQRLGFACSYELALSWLKPEVEIYSDRKKPSTTVGWKSASRAWPVETWMFLNATIWDFQEDGEAGAGDLQHWDCSSVSPKPRPSVLYRPALAPLETLEDYSKPIRTQVVDIGSKRVYTHTQVPLCLPFLSLSSSEIYLWTYFDRYITPQCVLNPDFNPYRDIILRIAESSQNGPLFHCVLAVAANQLHSMGFVEYKPVMWLHRAKALHLLRIKLGSIATATDPPRYDSDAEDQIISTTLMLCFFEILQDCSRSWVIHTKFAGGFLVSGNNRPLNHERQLLRQFALTYIHSHSILAATAGTEADNTISNAVGFANTSIVQALTGCSGDILTSISEINWLGSLMQGVATSQDVDMVKQSRNNIERRLHQCDGQANPGVSAVDPEFMNVSEVKRLATLLYLYSRIDLAGPQEPHMIRITTQILSLLPKISLRTNTILWPLFIVAVLGIRSGCDEDRKVVLARLHALQETRQLGNVKKARCIIEDVWKTRDLRGTDINRGWSILEGRDQALSLA